MKILNQTITILAMCGLSVAMATAEDLAVFKIQDSSRPFLFNVRPSSDPLSSASTTNATKQGVEGFMVILSKGFKTERKTGIGRTGVVEIDFSDVVVCQAGTNKSEVLGPAGGTGVFTDASPVFWADGYRLYFPGDTRILVRGDSVLLADLSEKTFEHGSSQPNGAANGSQSTRSKTNRTVASAAPDPFKIVKDSSSDRSGLTRTSIASGPNPAAAYDSVRKGEKAQATFSGGDGSSVKNAVVITAKSERTGNRAAYIWLHEHYPGSHLQEEGTDYDDTGRYYTEIKIVTADGKSRIVFFETTSFWGNGEK